MEGGREAEREGGRAGGGGVGGWEGGRQAGSQSVIMQSVNVTKCRFNLNCALKFIFNFLLQASLV